MKAEIRDNAFWAGFAAVLMLIGGFYQGFTGTSANPTYNEMVTVFNWMLRLGGFALVIVTVLCLLKLRSGLYLDVAVSAICGAVMIVCAGYWIISGGGFDYFDVLVVVFGFMFIRSSIVNWSVLQQTGAAPAAAPRPVPPAEPPHPASIHPDVLPSSDQPPPAEGYLAALAREKESPPRATYE